MRRALIPSLIAILISAAVPATAGRRPVASLTVGEAAFWHGPYIKQAGGGDCGRDNCFEYLIRVADSGERLRVALDFPIGNDSFQLRLFDPSGRRVPPQSTGLYSKEAFVRFPRPGTYRAVVVAQNASRTAFRMRAKLEGQDESPPRGLLLPDLRVEPPFDFTFDAPGIILGGASVSGFGAGSCGPDEMAEDGASRCLRFSVGPQNAGPGPLVLRFSPASDALAGEAPMYQVLYYSNDKTKERRAGTYEFHKTHAHYHFSGFASLELFRVVDADRGKLERSGQGNKSGFCFGDVMMNSWERFIHARAGTSRSSCQSATEAYMGLSSGWTDIYDWATPGNYVEFGDNPDGRYVIRATVDERDQILEASDANNVSYALVSVSGERVTVIERGYGADPWDPAARPVIDWVKRLKP